MTESQKSLCAPDINLMSERFTDNLVKNVIRYNFCISIANTTRVTSATIKKLNDLSIPV